MARLLLPVFLCLASAPFLASTPTSTHTCMLDLTSLAVISCQGSPPQSPTPSCCDALLYAVDLIPSFELDRGVCCLCKFMMTRVIPFDLPSVYRSCHGKDASTVGAWPMPTPSQGDCSGPCYEDAPAPPATSGRGNNGSKKPENTLGSGAIIAIAVGAVVVVLLIVYCLCKKRRGGKTRESPRPRDDDSSQDTGVEMARVSSSRNLL